MKKEIKKHIKDYCVANRGCMWLSTQRKMVNLAMDLLDGKTQLKHHNRTLLHAHVRAALPEELFNHLRSKKRYDEDFKARVRALRAEGYAYDGIAYIMGCSATTAIKYCK